jgi:hypothetical protein
MLYSVCLILSGLAVMVGPLLFLYAVLKVFANHPGVIFPGYELLLFKVPNLAITENWAY